jgi:phosphocarrier protein
MHVECERRLASSRALSHDVVVINELGLHARSAAKIAGIARRAGSRVWLIRGQERADASSTLEVLTLACARGAQLTVAVDDASDLRILEDLVRLFANGFEE